MTEKKANATKTKTAQNNRKLRQPGYKSFRLSKRLKHSAPKLPSVLKLIRRTIEHLWKHKVVWLSILGIFAVVQVIFVQGVLGGSVTEFTDTLDVLYNDVSGGITSLALLTYIVGTTGKASTEGGGVYQIIFVIIISLALIWMLRQTMAGTRIGVRDTFYKGMYPLVPFVLVLLVIGLQLLPMAFGAWLYQVIVSTGVAVTAVEHVFWVVIAGLFALLTIYMLCSSVFAAYIVTLPDMTPMRALRSARGLVLHRRLAIVWRVLVFLLLLVIAGALLLVPVIFLVPVAATWVFYVLGVLGLGLFHAYMYGLYRELLQDA